MLRLRTAKIVNTLYKAAALTEDARYGYTWYDRRGRVQLTEAQQEEFLHRARTQLNFASALLDEEIERIAVQ
jgi:hypothetical protein